MCMPLNNNCFFWYVLNLQIFKTLLSFFYGKLLFSVNILCFATCAPVVHLVSLLQSFTLNECYHNLPISCRWTFGFQLCSKFCQCLTHDPWIFLGALTSFQMLLPASMPEEVSLQYLQRCAASAQCNRPDVPMGVALHQ